MRQTMPRVCSLVKRPFKKQNERIAVKKMVTALRICDVVAVAMVSPMKLHVEAKRSSNPGMAKYSLLYETFSPLAIAISCSFFNCSGCLHNRYKKGIKHIYSPKNMVAVYEEALAKST